MASRFLLLLLALLPISVSASSQAPAEPQKKLLQNRNVRFGMPGEAKADAKQSKDAYLIDRPQYVISYNDKRKSQLGRVASGLKRCRQGCPRIV